jgi:DNA-binding CsgD family transcriptional regulator
MDEAEQVSQLVGDIYDASLDPALWPGVLESISGFVPGACVNLFSQDAVRHSANVHYIHGMEPVYVQSYNETYIKLNPVFPATLFFDVGTVICQNDIMPREQFNQTRFNKEWMAPQGWVDAMAAVLEKSAVSCAVLAVGRQKREGLIDAGARRRMALVVPHVRRAVLIGKVIDLNKVEAAALADTLDGLAAGMFLVDATGRIVHANARGHAMLAQGDAVHMAGLRLSSKDARAEQALQEVFAATAVGATGAKGIAVPLEAQEGGRHIAHVLPLTSGARRRAGDRYAAVAAVFVQQATAAGPTPFETIARHFKLTPAEVRVLFAIVQVGGVPEVAPVLGISETTVKTHLQRVFEKTSSKRQADLVKLVASYMSPLGGVEESQPWTKRNASHS